MSFFDTFCEMLVIFFAIGMGYLANRLKIMGGEMDQKVSKLLLYITVPAMSLGSVIARETLPPMGEILSILWVAGIFYGMELLFALAVPRILGGTPEQKGVWRYGMMFPNVGFIGYPVVVALLGQEALFYAVILALPFNMLSYSLGPLLLTGARRFDWKQFLSPCVVSSVAALILALARVQLPPLVGETLNFVGDMTVPLSLILVGSLLAGLPVRSVFSSARLWILSVLRLLVLPAILAVVLHWVDVSPMVKSVAIIQAAMPMAVNGSMLCLEYGGDTECMARATFITTLAAIITIPLLAPTLL